MMASESSSSSADSYIGSFISLISKYEIRYEGVLYYINTQDSTIGLKDVRSFGTEGRKKDGPNIPPSDRVYEYILFRGSDIKDLQVKSSPPNTEEQIHNDPAIIQSHYSGSPLSSSSLASVGGTLIASAHYQDTPALTSRAYPSALPLYQSGAQSSPSGISGAPPFAMPIFWPGHNGNSISTSHAPQQRIPFQPTTTSFPLTVQNPTQDSQTHASTTKGTSNSLEFVSPIPSSISSNSVHPSLSEFVSPIPSFISSNSVHPSFSLTPTPTQCSTSLDKASFLSLNESLPSPSASIPANRLTMSSFSSGQDMNILEAQCFVKAVSDPISSVLPVQSMPYPALSFSGSTPSPLLMAAPSLLTLDQLAQHRQHMLSPIPKLYPDQQDTAVMPTSCYSSCATQAPLLPLPISVQQSQQSTLQYTEEFDFVAMNEKFKKDEVWGYLGKAKQSDKIDSMEGNAIDQSLVDNDGHGRASKFNSKPSYNKDEFFDTISCNSLSRGTRNGQNRFSERMKHDSQTFGNFQPRNHLGYGAGRGENYWGSYNRGRGYGYGGRGRGGNMPI